ncbi:acyl-CoA N-acyltransferase [Trichoderma ceciliae]
MPIQARRATEEEIPAIARLAGVVFHPTTDWITRQVFPLHLQPKDIPDGESSQLWRRLRKTACFHTANCAVIVAVDTTLNNQIVGFALWDLPVETEEAPVTAADPDLPPDVTDLKVYARLQSILKEDHKATFGDRGLKDVWHLDLIGVDPLQQRKGVGKALLTWGVRQATKANRDCYLMATPQGRPLYEAFGFDIVRPLDMFGVMHHSMILRANKEAMRITRN